MLPSTIGSLTALDGPLFFITSTTAAIELTDVRLSESSGTLPDTAPAGWEDSGSNGGNHTVDAWRSLSGAAGPTTSAPLCRT